MEKVILLKKHLKKFEFLEKTDGRYEDGIWIEGTETIIPFKAAPFPVDGKTLKLYPEGTVNTEDLLLYTKFDSLSKNDEVTRILNGDKYRIFDNVAYLEIADLKVYLIKRVIDNG